MNNSEIYTKIKNNIDIEDLCNKLNETNFEWKPNHQFLNDINLFLIELKNHNNLEVDVYELLVSCGSDINWSMEYFITITDLLWFKTDGKNEFIKFINNNIRELSSIIDYNNAINIHNKLCELFELQLDKEYDI